MDEMENNQYLINVFINVRSLRKFSRLLTLEQLENALTKLNIIIEERRKKELEIMRLKATRERKLIDLAKKLNSEGFDISQLLEVNSRCVIKKKGGAMKMAKYKYTDRFGNDKTWTGKGRMPLAIKYKLNEGCNLDDFLINK